MVAFTCAAAPELHFAGAAFLSREQRADPARMRRFLEPELARARIDRIEIVAGDDSVRRERARGGSLALDDLPGPALQLIALVLQETYVGAEVDILVQGTGPLDPDRMWTVLRDLSGGVVVVRGEPPRTLEGPDPTSQELSARFGIGALEDTRSAHWVADERRALARALALLAPEELELLRGVAFARRDASGVAMQAGIYEREASREDVGRITLFDLAFVQKEKMHYVGPPDAASPYSVYVVTHEIAHAITDLHLQRAIEHYRQDIDRYNARNASLNAVIETYNANVKRLRDADRAQRAEPELERRQRELEAEIGAGQRALEDESRRIGALRERIEKVLSARPPMERAYASLPNALGGPTPYGRTDPTESFAEAFALYHVDPESLRRIAPEVHAWFEAGEHLRVDALALE